MSAPRTDLTSRTGGLKLLWVGKIGSDADRAQPYSRQNWHQLDANQKCNAEIRVFFCGSLEITQPCFFVAIEMRGPLVKDEGVRTLLAPSISV
jgi:hypothetical protein